MALQVLSGARHFTAAVSVLDFVPNDTWILLRQPRRMLGKGCYQVHFGPRNGQESGDRAWVFLGSETSRAQPHRATWKTSGEITRWEFSDAILAGTVADVEPRP